MAAIGGLRWLLGDLDKVTKSKVFAPLVAFVPIFATGVSLLFVSKSTLTTFAAVSYTHLDVYKRQVSFRSVLRLKQAISLSVK